ncbi:hypothetical protein P8936_10460 [Edaphobacter paludis]|uniref:Uncharacterized protein n=1 Tax=Edaphobacter paludis TaxID=3035702 RepID=A0AAU7D3L5_9BACT
MTFFLLWRQSFRISAEISALHLKTFFEIRVTDVEKSLSAEKATVRKSACADTFLGGFWIDYGGSNVDFCDGPASGTRSMEKVICTENRNTVTPEPYFSVLRINLENRMSRPFKRERAVSYEKFFAAPRRESPMQTA